MKLAKLFVILAIILGAIIVSLRIAGVIPADVASDTLGRTLGILAVLALAAAAVTIVAGGRGPQDPPADGPEPKF